MVGYLYHPLVSTLDNIMRKVNLKDLFVDVNHSIKTKPKKVFCKNMNLYELEEYCLLGSDVV
jgi:hypothetical protein